jgi:CheY-like chemotaxis protein
MAFTRKEKAEPKPIDVDALIERSADLLERLLTEQVRLEIAAGAGGMVILADAVQLEQILMNLAANARDAMPEGGTLTIATDVIGADDPYARRHGLDKADRYLCIAIRDTGIGMDEATRARIFEPFFTTKDVGKGTGLGLSTVFAVTRNLGGHIHVDSNLGKGTTFTLAFPCREGKRESPSLRSSDLVRFEGTVLLVEDEPLIRLTVRHYLEELGLTVVDAEGADEALEQCDAHTGPFELLVSDIVLPVMRGPKLAALIRQRYPEIRVLFISANPAFVGQEQAFIAGAAVLQKPFGKEELADKLDQLMKPGRPSEQPAAESTAGNGGRASDSSAGRARTVLLVEDEPTSLLALKELLGSRGYRVLAAATPSQALALAEGHAGPIDLLLTDVRLPEMQGEQLADRLRSSHAELRVVYMSGLPDRPAGGSAFVQKPIDFDDLAAVLEQTLRG